MRKIVYLSVCLACSGYGRQFQISSIVELQRRSLNSSQTPSKQADTLQSLQSLSETHASNMQEVTSSMMDPLKLLATLLLSFNLAAPINHCQLGVQLPRKQHPLHKHSKSKVASLCQRFLCGTSAAVFTPNWMFPTSRTISSVKMASGDTSELEKAPLVITAAVTGALTGLIVALFKLSIASVASICYSGNDGVMSSVPRTLIPMCGGLIVATIRFLSPRASIGPGLAEHITEVERSLPIRTEASVARGAAAVASLGTGNSLGPEGPSVELGVTISRLVEGLISSPQQFNFSSVTLQTPTFAASSTQRKKRELVAAGAAAGVAAGFNAPLAGVFFALEVVCGAARSVVVPDPEGTPPTSSQDVATESLVLSRSDRTELDIKSKEAISGCAVAALVAAVVVQEILGNELALRPGVFEVRSPLVDLPLSVGLGALSGLLAILFDKSTSTVRTLFGQIGGQASESKTVDILLPLRAAEGAFSGKATNERQGLDPQLAEFARPVLGGLACGLIGAAFPQILFFGYATVDDILATGMPPSAEESSKILSGVSPSGLSGADLDKFPDQIALLAAKLLATSICAGSGLVGGTFAPSIFLGAVLGIAYQTAAGFGLAELAHVIADYQTSIGVPVGSWGVIPQLTIAATPSYAILGAAATLASVFRAPLTASLLLFELTRNYDIILPLLAATGTGPLVVELVTGDAFSKNKGPVMKNSVVPEECDIDNKIICDTEDSSTL